MGFGKSVSSIRLIFFLSNRGDIVYYIETKSFNLMIWNYNSVRKMYNCFSRKYENSDKWDEK